MRRLTPEWRTTVSSCMQMSQFEFAWFLLRKKGRGRNFRDFSRTGAAKKRGKFPPVHWFRKIPAGSLFIVDRNIAELRSIGTRSL
jgi:hypothetical protein